MVKFKFPRIGFLWPIFALLLICLILAFLNYQPGTWLTGWDNLHPEFNLPLNLERSLNATWQEYQSTGLLGGMGHAADLPRQLILYLTSTIFHLSSNSLRYLWTFSMLTAGPLGVYFLAYFTLLKRFGSFTRRIAAFFAGLFYLLNLSTIQTFYTPFEAFISFYGFLPWLLFSTINYLEKPNRRNWLLLTVTCLLSSPSFYVQTLFLVFLITLIPICLPLPRGRDWPKAIRGGILPRIILLVTILTTQAYWLFPVTYFSLTSSSTTVNAAQNLVATPEVIARNHEFGNFANVALLKSFLFKYADLSPNNQFQFLLGPWVNHLNNPSIAAIGFAFFALILVGLFFALRHKLSHAIPFAFLFLISLFFLINDNPPTGFIYQFLQNHFTLFYQSFRSVYTKWSIPASLSYSLFFSLGVVFLLRLFSSLHDRMTIVLTSFSLIFLLLAFSGPALSGNLIYPSMRVNIPAPYFELFDFFNSQDPNTRIANFPQNTPWGWQFYGWGYRGSGFLWYGLQQPILDRAFDVWSPYSAAYYDEVKAAIYSQNPKSLENIFEKYSVNWILVDNSIINPGNNDQSSLYLPQLEKMLKSSSQIKLVKTFNFLDVYQVNLQTHPTNFLSTSSVTIPFNSLTDQQINPVFTDTPLSNHSANNEPLAKGQSASGGKNCDPLLHGTHHKIISQNEVLYDSQGANGCDHFLYPSLQLNRPYQIKIEHRNLAGLPFLYCVEPYPAKSCLLFGYLPKSSDWTTTTLTLPQLKAEEYGFTLHLFNNSVGNVFTSNAWRKIEISGLPSLRLTDQQINSSTGFLTSSTHPTYSLYTATVVANRPDTPLALDQGFDTGWKAYLVNETTLRQPTWLLYLQSLMLIPLPENLHQLSAGWANSWLLPEGTHHLLIVYMPQHLQYLGFALLFFLPVLILFHLKRHQ